MLHSARNCETEGEAGEGGGERGNTGKREERTGEMRLICRRASDGRALWSGGRLCRRDQFSWPWPDLEELKTGYKRR